MSRLVCAVLLLLAAAVLPVAAHEPSMASLDLREIRPGSFVGRWLLTPGTGDEGLRPLFPPQCRWAPPELDCGPQGLQGKLGFAGLGGQQSCSSAQRCCAPGAARPA